MRFSVSFSHHGLARARRVDADQVESIATATTGALGRLTELARAAEASGADAVWVSEDPEGWDAFATLTLLATATATIRLGTGVTSPLLRHPNQLAAAVATLDLISSGRAFLGIGRGEPDWYRHGLGIEVPDRPLDALRQTIELLRAWWEPPHRVVVAPGVEPEGPFPVRDWERTIAPWPGRRGPIPIVVAAAGPRALRLAGQRADGVLFNDLASDDYLRWAIATVRASATTAGRDARAIHFTYGSPVVLTDDPLPELERRRTTLALVNALPGMDRQLAGAGYDIPPLIAAIRETLDSDGVRAAGGGFPAIRRGGRLPGAAGLVPTGLIDRLAIIGPADHVRHRLETLAAIGIDEVFVALPPADQPSSSLRDRLSALRAMRLP